MKTIKQMALLLGAGVILVSLSAGTLSAQTKPKGKEWKVPEVDSKKKSTVKGDDAVTAGKEIWVQQCKSCHGVKGKGDGAKAEKLEISMVDFTTKEFQDLTDGDMYYKTTEGRKPMPSFKEKLSDTERWQVVAYMRTLK